MCPNEFCPMKDIGVVIGASNHVVGRWLVELGLRDGTIRPIEPTPRAWQEGFCKQRRDPESGHFLVVWHKQKTIQALEEAGLIPKQQEEITVAAPAIEMTGPFTSNKTGEMVEIVNRNGQAVCVGYSEKCARQLLWLLNLAHQHGKLTE